MKSVISVVFAILIILAIVPAAVNAVVIPYVGTASTIDGNDADPAYAGLPSWSFLAPAYLFLDSGVDSEKDCGLVLTMGRDAENFYFFARLTDEEILTKNWSDWRESDCIAIGINQKIILAIPDQQTLRLLDPGKDIPGASITGKVVTARCPEGWKVEGSIPLNELGGIGPTTKFVVIQRDWDGNQTDYNCVGSNPNAVYALVDNSLWGTASVSDGANITVNDDQVKVLPDGSVVTTRLGWPVIYTGNGFFICEDPCTRVKGLKVNYQGQLPRINDLVVSLTGKSSAAGFLASTVEIIPAEASLIRPFGLNSRALLSSGPRDILVKLTGKVTRIIPGYGFVLNDGQEVAIGSSSSVKIGDVASVTGVSLGATEFVASQVKIW